MRSDPFYSLFDSITDSFRNPHCSQVLLGTFENSKATKSLRKCHQLGSVQFNWRYLFNMSNVGMGRGIAKDCSRHGGLKSTGKNKAHMEQLNDNES